MFSPPKKKAVGSKGAGRFQMGYIQGGGRSNEQPVHEVSVAQFTIRRYEVTVGEFRSFVNATGYQTDAEREGNCWVVGNRSGKTASSWIFTNGE